MQREKINKIKSRITAAILQIPDSSHESDFFGFNSIFNEQLKILAVGELWLSVKMLDDLLLDDTQRENDN